MSTPLNSIISQFKSLRVLVIGDAMLDCYLDGSSARICQEAPVPIVDISSRKYVPGGAANTAANVTAMGGYPLLLSVTGCDHEAERLRESLDHFGVSDSHLVAAPERRTLSKNRVISASQILLRFDDGTTDPVAGSAEELLIQQMEKLYSECDAVVISDYGYGVVTPSLISCLEKLRIDREVPLVIDSKRLRLFKRLAPTAVKPNYVEALNLLGKAPPADKSLRAETIASCGHRILSIANARLAAVTLDTEGAFLFEGGRPPYRTYADPARHSRAAGAGDTFLSGLTLALAANSDTAAAAEIASAAAAIATSRDGTTVCTGAELEHLLTSPGKHTFPLSRLQEQVEAYRRQGRRIVFTNGCFDILHRGHITYLNQAKTMGDILIVGVNSDASVHRLKGPDRPINVLEDRVQVLAALSCIDHIVSFSEDTPENLIAALCPDVFVKGGDYTWETLPEAKLVERLGGEVRILPYEPNRSTTGIIERIREVYGIAHGNGR